MAVRSALDTKPQVIEVGRGFNLGPGEAANADRGWRSPLDTDAVVPASANDGSPAPQTPARSTGCPRSRLVDTVHWAGGFAFLVDPAKQVTIEPGQRACWFDMRDLPPERTADIDIVVNQVIASDHRPSTALLR